MKTTTLRCLSNSIIFLALFLILARPAFAYMEPPICVGLVVEAASASVSATGGIDLCELRYDKPLVSMPEKTEITFKRDGDKVVSSTGHKAEAFTLYAKAGFLKVGGKEYRGSMLIIIQGKGISVINKLPLEEYLRGVVPAEISPNWEMEAIKAQAVAARTYALNRIANKGDKPFDVWASTSDQLYGGVAYERATTDDAIRATRGLAITYEGEPIIAYYSASAAGCTADPSDAFGKQFPYLKPVISLDADCFAWTLDVTNAQLAGVLSALGQDIGKLRDIVIDEYGPSGYVITVKFSGSKGTVSIPARELRKNLGYGKLKSTRFAIGKDGKFPPITVESSDTEASGDVPGLAGAEILIEAEGKPVLAISTNGPETTDLAGSVALCASGRMQIGGECYLIGWNKSAAPSAAISTVGKPEEFKPVIISDGITFKGIGFGHGVGMSQHGANNYAKSGWDYSRILLHYYSGVKLESFYE